MLIVTAAIGANVNNHGPGSGANTTGHLHNMSSMAFGMGTSAVGSPGFGQFLGPNSSSLVSNSGLEAQLGGSLFSGQARSHSGGDQRQGTYHPFGSSGGLVQDHGLNPGACVSVVIMCCHTVCEAAQLRLYQLHGFQLCQWHIRDVITSSAISDEQHQTVDCHNKSHPVIFFHNTCLCEIKQQPYMQIVLGILTGC